MEKPQIEKYVSTCLKITQSSQIDFVYNTLDLLFALTQANTIFFYCNTTNFIIAKINGQNSVQYFDAKSFVSKAIFTQSTNLFVQDVFSSSVAECQLLATPENLNAVYIGIPLIDDSNCSFGKIVILDNALQINSQNKHCIELLSQQLKNFISVQCTNDAFEKLHSFYLEAGPLAIIEWDNEFSIQKWSAKAQQYFGWQQEEVLGKKFSDFNFLHQNDIVPFANVFSSFLTNNEIQHQIECTCIAKDGVAVSCIWYHQVKRDIEGNIFSIFSMVDNISPFKVIQAELKRSEERLSLAIEGSSDGIWDWNVKEDIAYFSPRFRQMVGYPPQEYIAGIAALQEAVHPDDLNATLQAIELHFTRKIPFSHEYRLKMVTGGYRWFLVRGQAIFNEVGEPIRMTGSLTDIQHKKEAEDKLLQSNRALVESKIAIEKINKLNSAIISALPDLMFKFSYDGYILDYFTSDIGLLYTSPSSFIGKKISEVLPPNVAQLINEAIITVGKNKVATSFNYQLPIQGSIKYFEARLTFINETEYLCIVRDISEIKTIETSIIYKTSLLNALAEIAISSLGSINWHQLVKQSLDLIGNTFICSRVHYFETYIDDEDKGEYQKIALEWVNNGINCQLNNPKFVKIDFKNEILIFNKSKLDDVHTLIVNDMPEGHFKNLLIEINNQSILVIQIEVNGNVIGAIGIDECTHARQWTIDEKSTLQSIVNILKLNYEKCLSNQALEKNNERFSYVMKATDDLIWDWDLVNNTIERSENGFKIVTGFDYNEVEQTLPFWPERIHPDDRDELMRKYKDSLLQKDQFFWSDEFRFLQKNGTYAYVEDRCYIIRDKEGKAIRAIGATHNITQQKLLSIELQNNEQRFRSMIQNVSDIITLVNEQGQIMYESASSTLILGYDEHELIGRHIFELLHPDDIGIVQQKFAENLSEPGVGPIVQFRYKSKSGNYILLEARGNNQLNNEAIKAVIVTSRDITERKKVEEAIKESEIKFKSLVQNISDIISIVDASGKIIYQSSSVKQKMGYQENELSNMNITSIIHPDDVKNVLSAFNDLLKSGGSTNTIEFRIKDKNGEYFYIEAQATNQINNPTIKGIVINSRDITQRKNTEEERKRLIDELTKNNADLKQFTYIASHNLRAPLTNLLSINKLIDKSTIADKRTLQLIDGIGISTKKLSDTLNDLRDILIVKNNTNLPIEKLDLYQSLTQVMVSLHSIIEDAGLTISYNFSGASSVLFNKTYLESIFINLITNSIRYASKFRKPNVVIKSYYVHDAIVLTFKDNGIGFDMKLAAGKIFSMHQRFHHHPEGRGIGLYLVHSQLTSMGGTIEANSEENVGTTFTITFKNK